ncbi:uncharacterized protein Tco025E_05918 [Trypanosoma conorhini]|uniref:Uncharacterized protein n=1 Tax=Trypanosoma conorhini TaxID=83891 RepID=A0A3R7P8C9_9TRYP|nr:uncharacterized protein Tco025E_05918 [Trypanosoma conorhini]RNF14360.1 hypothetical protein Tco025E_05918 [Trypanosoma conorhini]
MSPDKKALDTQGTVVSHPSCLLPAAPARLKGIVIVCHDFEFHSTGSKEKLLGTCASEIPAGCGGVVNDVRALCGRNGDYLNASSEYVLRHGLHYHSCQEYQQGYRLMRTPRRNRHTTMEAPVCLTHKVPRAILRIQVLTSHAVRSPLQALL